MTKPFFRTLFSILFPCLRRRRRPEREGTTSGQPGAAVEDEDGEALSDSMALDDLGPDAISVVQTALRNKDWEVRAEADPSAAADGFESKGSHA